MMRRRRNKKENEGEWEEETKGESWSCWLILLVNSLNCAKLAAELKRDGSRIGRGISCSAA
jgi:hypothetical protein